MSPLALEKEVVNGAGTQTDTPTQAYTQKMKEAWQEMDKEGKVSLGLIIILAALSIGTVVMGECVCVCVCVYVCGTWGGMCM
jgi:hypothetical protein